jgi:TRAP transporter 4TM/12TM fusion protein
MTTREEEAALLGRDTREGPTGAPDPDAIPVEPNRRLFAGGAATAAAVAFAAYAFFHIVSLNVYPIETWTFRLIHICGALVLGFLIFGASSWTEDESRLRRRPIDLAGLALIGLAAWSLIVAVWMRFSLAGGAMRIEPWIDTWAFGVPLMAATGIGIVLSWMDRGPRPSVTMPDVALAVCAVASSYYLILVYGGPLRMSTGTPFAPPGISWAAIAGTALIIEMTRRLAGLALVVITLIFLGYVFFGPYLPGFLSYPGFTVQRFFSQVYTDAGILGPTTAVSSTYIILFIIFGAFLTASRVGAYFVNFAFAVAGHARGGPAKVAIFASGLMGMINGTSAGNVVATGSLTIPLMKKVGYPAKTAASVEAAASTGGQIMPPIMGAGAFIMAEITGIPYTEIAIAAIIPALLYFVSIYFIVDGAAAILGMRGMSREELPDLREMVKQVYLFVPIVILIAALFMGYSVIRAGTYATAAAAVASWLTPYRMGPAGVFRAFELAGLMSLQIIAVCACAGIIVGVISLTGVGARFSTVLLDIAGASQLAALFFAMCISILLGMGMPTTAAYAVAASVVAPGLIDLGIQPLIAHFFVFYYAVISAITPPVALASYAGAAIAGSEPMRTSVESFKIGLAAFIVPFMFFYSPGLLLEGDWPTILRNCVTALVGVYLLAAAVTGWYFGRVGILERAALLAGAVCLIYGGLYTDFAGLAIAAALWLLQKRRLPQTA